MAPKLFKQMRSTAPPSPHLPRSVGVNLLKIQSSSSRRSSIGPTRMNISGEIVTSAAH